MKNVVFARQVEADVEHCFSIEPDLDWKWEAVGAREKAEAEERVNYADRHN